MNDEVDVERLPTRSLDSILQAVMKSSPPVHGPAAKHPSALEDPERVAIDREHGPAKSVEKNAARGLS